ncbi:purine catabolism regulator [Gordonia amarae]|uniref:Putative CdaR family transcriptional regulator n=1 Tax=Gordonia amarae NBRC 15530 TaxID=1075090 RepID=G7GUF0_9ACTN|nr:PucR family transcriptional regulator [Gordonia amarae]MCS3877429.1 purine catabolism regulator [Gordonia amarae]GAB07225.1 putative CdaR family transcriptional regulator [Gordonia amarae NBRC 15530]
MAVPVRWLLDQADLSLRLRTGSAGLTAEITFAVTTELPDPARWLSGGELILTTGLGLPDDPALRTAYIHGLHKIGVTAVGFGTGLTFDTVPPELIAAADDCGLALFEVPLATPFVAVAKTVMNRLAHQQYESVLTATRVQTRMTRAAAVSGAPGTLGELSSACGGPAIIIDRTGKVIHAARGRDTDDQNEAIAAGIGHLITRAGGGSFPHSSVVPLSGGEVAVVQAIRIGTRTYGYLAVGVTGTPSPIDQLLIGHANSLLGLEFERPNRVRREQGQVHAAALALALAGGTGTASAIGLLRTATDDRGRIRMLTVLDARDGETLRQVVDDQFAAHARNSFLHADGATVSILLRGTDDLTLAGSLFEPLGEAVRRHLRIGLSAAHALSEVRTAAAESRMAAGLALGEPVDATAITGRTLLAVPESRNVLTAMGMLLVEPLERYDAAHDSGLLDSLRAYLEANGQWEQAAAMLQVHRHTLRSRIVKAAEVIGCDLSSARVRAEVLLAIIARDQRAHAAED